MKDELSSRRVNSDIGLLRENSRRDHGWDTTQQSRSDNVGETHLTVKRIHIAAVFVCALILTACASAVETSGQNGGAADDSPIGRAFKNRTSNVQVEGEGVVTRILADDNSGSKHQRFIVRLKSGQTVLIAHNIDIAPRVAALQEADRVRFYGEYVWNEMGGMVHWTHHDPARKHVAGWVKHNGRTYQ